MDRPKSASCGITRKFKERNGGHGRPEGEDPKRKPFMNGMEWMFWNGTDFLERTGPEQHIPIVDQLCA